MCVLHCTGGAEMSILLQRWKPVQLPVPVCTCRAYLLPLVSASTIAAHVHCGFSARGGTSAPERITGEPRSLM